LFLRASSHSQNCQKDLDDVDVDLDCGKDVFLGRNRVLLASHDALGVKDEIARENQPDQSTINCMQDGPVRLPKDDGDDPEDEHADEHAVEVDAPSGEVVLGLECEDGECNADGGGDSHGHPEPVGVVEDGDAAHHEGERAREHEQRDQVGRKLAAQRTTANDHNVRHQEDHVAHDVQRQASLAVTQVPVPDGGRVCEESDDSGGECKLGEDDGVHLLDEGSANGSVRKGLPEAAQFDARLGRGVRVPHVVVDVQPTDLPAAVA